VRWQVIITPKSLGNFGFASMSDYGVEPDPVKRGQQYRERCEEIAREVKRHVDGVEDVSVEPVYEDDEIAPCEARGCYGEQRHGAHVKINMVAYDDPNDGLIHFCKQHAEEEIAKAKAGTR
jgi:hypothetical protein